MKVTETSLPGVLLVEPKVFGDPRGFFFESYNALRYRDAGIPGPFVQDNVSLSQRGVLRGLHVQHPYAQGKLVQVLRGEVFDVAVDVRVGSPTFAHWVGEYLSGDDKRQLWIPPGFAHGFVVTSDEAMVAYKATDHFHPESQRTICWNDPRIGVDWPTRDVVLSGKDTEGIPLHEIPADQLPAYVP